MDKKNQAEIQKKYLELEIYDRQLKQIHEQVEKIDSQAGELAGVAQSLQELSGISKSSEILVPVNTGIFAKAKIEPVDSFVVNVGANVAVKKSVEETIELLNQQMIEITNHRNHMAEVFQELSVRAQLLQGELQKLVE